MPIITERKFMKILSFILISLFPFFVFAGEGGIFNFCRSFFLRRYVPSKVWTVSDHNPLNQQSILSDGLLFFIDEGRIFIRDVTDGSSPFHITDTPMPVKRLSKARAIVLFDGNLIALTKDNKVYRLDEKKKREEVPPPWPKKQLKWTKIGDNVNHIAVSDLGNGEESLSMSSQLDPITGNPL